MELHAARLLEAMRAAPLPSSSAASSIALFTRPRSRQPDEEEEEKLDEQKQQQQQHDGLHRRCLTDASAAAEYAPGIEESFPFSLSPSGGHLDLPRTHQWHPQPRLPLKPAMELEEPYRRALARIRERTSATAARTLPSTDKSGN